MNTLMIETREKLQKECDNLNRLKEKLSSSNKKTKEMCSILSKFDERLSKLEQTIAPVYEETGNLQKKQEKIVKSCEQLDFIIKYYNIANQVDTKINAGPTTENFSDYLETLDRLQEAIDYFEENNPNSTILKDLIFLYDKGAINVLKEFKQLLSRHTKPITSSILYQLVHEEEKESINKKKKKITINDSIPEDLYKLLADWLCKNRLDNFITLYAEFKSSILERSLSGLKNFNSSNNLESSLPNQKGFNTLNIIQPSNNFSPSVNSQSNNSFSTLSNNRLTPKTIQNALKKKFHDVPVENFTSLLPITDKEIVNYLTIVTAFYKLVKNESELIEKIISIPNHREIILSKLVLFTLNQIVEEGKSLASRVKKFTQKHDFNLALNLFPILRHHVTMQVKFDKLFYGCSVEVQQKLKGLITVLQTTINTTLEGFIEFIKEDNDTKVPRDGTVHELTSNIMLFVAQLNPYMEILNRVIIITDMQGLDNSSNTNKIAYAQYICRVLAALSMTLNKKNQSYSDPYLKAIFMLNNYHYILKSLKKSGLLDIVHIYNQKIERFYEDQILDNKRIYSQSWSRVLNLILSNDINLDYTGFNNTTLTNMRLKDKDKRLIKDKFVGFNKEIEEIRQKQKNYAIPDIELCSTLKKDNKDFIVPKYTIFFNRYRLLDFSKNPQKYLKYEPEHLAQIIDTFFDSTA